ncbi:hypothetical protein TNCT_297811 [Trichonephila clavata]|uniref:Uncharacterized protein n=1 Tax=Trichonephila clavata TaxID=2740835 RepID=A0A8X6GC25_TRICU|nr:hypothetical protein TNCT_297811 [Trichonephila clavata]
MIAFIFEVWPQLRFNGLLQFVRSKLTLPSPFISWWGHSNLHLGLDLNPNKSQFVGAERKPSGELFLPSGK